MRKIFSVILILLLCIGIKAQHTLQFNQAILVSNSQTVPANTVWKVVAVLPSSNSIERNTGYSSSPGVGTFAITVNSNPIYLSKATGDPASNYEGGNFSYTNITGDGVLPMWLPAGTTLAASTNIQYVSVLEFIVN